VIRADDGPITIGEQTSIQDGSVLHTIGEHPTRVGSRCTIGHIVHLEGCEIEDNALVGNGSVFLHRAVVESWSLVARMPSSRPAWSCPCSEWCSEWIDYIFKQSVSILRS
jgi:carbonic anhydrase/acetyltransferase-like protein (isoleucine patch superfamily)